jgi:hypothetical protein
MAALEVELEMLRHHVIELLDYVGARGASLIERLDNACATFGTLLTSTFIVGL